MANRLTPHQILVTGATGFIGGHVAEMLISQGHRVRTLARQTSTPDFPGAQAMEMYAGDLLNPLHVDRSVAGCGTIVHCAAKVGDWGYPSEFLRQNLGGLKNVLASASRNPVVSRVVLVSSLGVYAAQDHFGTSEHAPLAEQALDGYTLSKIQCEQYFTEWMARHPHVTGVILRPGFVYGPRDRTVIPRLVEALKKGKFAFFGDGQKLLNATYVGNFCVAVARSLDRELQQGRCNVFNITDVKLPTRWEFVSELAGQLGLKTPNRFIPTGLARVVCNASEIWARISGKQAAPLLSKAKFKFLALNLDFSVEKAQRELGYSPPWSLTLAMTQTGKWIRGEPYGVEEQERINATA